MKRLGLTLLVLATISATAYYVFTHPSVDRAEHLQEEVDELREQNRRLAEQNEELEREVIALGDDPRLAERKVRESSGLVRPDEVVFQFDDQEDEIEMAVTLRVEPEALELAGENIDIDHLEEALSTLDEDVPNARLRVLFAESADELRRQRVRDAVDSSSLEGADFETFEMAQQ